VILIATATNVDFPSAIVLLSSQLVISARLVMEYKKTSASYAKRAINPFTAYA